MSIVKLKEAGWDTPPLVAQDKQLAAKTNKVIHNTFFIILLRLV
jgi:hypothetical protein